jgi:hypothetical protein
MTNLELHINHSITDSPYGTSGVEFIQVDPVYDYFIFSEGSLPGSGVSDGDALPTETLLNRYAVQLDDTDPVIVPKYFLADNSSGLLKEVKLAGNLNKRYVFVVDFDGATATEPQLEAWDNSSMNTIIDAALGAGTPGLSWYKVVNTTLASPGADWVGTPLAGSGGSNILLLNNGSGALAVATTLYFNFKIVIPGGYLSPGLHTPILAIIYATN